MCGIAGLIHRGKSSNVGSELQGMLQALKHRVMSAYKEGTKLSVEELKTKLFKTSRPKSALIITEACEKGFFRLEKTSTDQRIKNIMPSESFINEFNNYLVTLKNISY